MPDRPTRRRVLRIFAAAAMAGAGWPARAQDNYEWRGIAMGADACIRFSGIDSTTARAATDLAVAEIERLERALSLFRDDSEICRLNRDGILPLPGADLRHALQLALAVARVSGGLFDPTVQALWETHVDWFAHRPDAGLPPAHLIAQARKKVGWRNIACGADAIRLGEAQRITLNGLGQGYVTDRVADLLRMHGLKHVLVDLGEQRALGPRDDAGPWLIERPGAAPIGLAGGSLATSEGAGFVFGADGDAHHLFDPRSGRSAAVWRRLTVHHRSAALADALSTALYAASADEIAAVTAQIPGVVVWATDAGGHNHRWICAPVEGLVGEL